jgi:pyrroline-5-carboxylate reductase
MARPKLLGFLGAGVMAEALARGFLQRAGLRADQLIASDIAPARLALFREELGIEAVAENRDVVQAAETVFLATKPQVLTEVLVQVGPSFADDQLLVSIAAGVRTSTIRHQVAAGVPIVRVMPNICCTVSEGAFAYCTNGPVSDGQVERIEQLLGSVGRVVRVDEKLMDAVTGLSGSGPAFVFLLIEALADGGVAAGLSRADAQVLAAQTVLGAGKMVLESGRQPGTLKDMVCSPGGTTIEGVRVLRERGFEAAAMEAVIHAAQRSRELGS